MYLLSVHTLSEKLHLPERSPSPTPKAPRSLTPRTSSKTSQPPGSAGDTSYLSWPGSPDLQPAAPIWSQQISDPSGSPSPWPTKPGPCPASPPKAPSPRGSVSRPRPDSDGLGSCGEDRKEAAAAARAPGGPGAGDGRARARLALTPVARTQPSRSAGPRLRGLPSPDPGSHRCRCLPCPSRSPHDLYAS